MLANATPTHEDILAETRRFEVLGGCIEKLPEQAVAPLVPSVQFDDGQKSWPSRGGIHVATEFDLYSESAA